MASGAHILVVDDDERLRKAAGKVLSAAGYRVTGAALGREALEVLQREGVALVVSDLRLPDLDGLALLEQARQLRPEAEVVMLTGHGSIEKAVEAMRLGAYDFIEKPLDSPALLKTVAKALEKQRLASENRLLRLQLQQRRGVEALIGDSPPMQAFKQLIRQIAPADVNVLIQGESGTGKELIAKALHANSPRKDKPFVPVNTGSMPSELLESTLFGHVKGAFTSAIATKKGLFEVANGGTLFLDEIGNMAMDTQAKILRVLQDRRFTPLGGIQETQVDVRIVAATNVDLRNAVRDGKFRDDLFYRLNVISIDLPPLRGRREDIPLLVNRFLEHFSKENEMEPRKLTADAMRALVDYEWPGNVRELENIIERGVVLSSTPIIGSGLLPGHITGRTFQDALLEHNPNASLFDILEDIERRIIMEKLERNNWNQTDAAEQFHIPLSTLNQKIKRLNIEIRKKGRD
jgi:DNA-binding NtrC family response regulator